MKLIIDIDEKDYKALVGNITGLFSVYDILANVKSGIPLDNIRQEIIECVPWNIEEKAMKLAILGIIDERTRGQNEQS